MYWDAGASCRAAVGACDVEEACSGLTHTCLENIYLQNGQSCGLGAAAALCYNGECNSHDAQCKRTWDSSSVAEPRACYDRNVMGTIGANCGVNWTEYDPL